MPMNADDEVMRMMNSGDALAGDNYAAADGGDQVVPLVMMTVTIITIMMVTTTVVMGVICVILSQAPSLSSLTPVRKCSEDGCSIDITHGRRERPRSSATRT